MQEPLRKIQQFGDLLKTDYADALGEGMAFVNRMQLAASRMSTLIKDLLGFSQLTNRQEIWQPVSLNQVVEEVLLDLELIVQETGAQITVDSLPTVVGDPSQLGQLMQNLLSIALKFRRLDVSPVIEVKAQLVLSTELPPRINPIRPAQIYHQIDVIDNGIGFDQKYAERIFSGISAAARQKPVRRYGHWFIYLRAGDYQSWRCTRATSQMGEGAVFSVYLPV